MAVRRITRALQRQGSYFVLEILVIIIGITLSLAINSWWESRKDERLAMDYLASIKADLEKDVTVLEKDLKMRQGQLQAAQQLITFLRNDTMNLAPSTFVQNMVQLIIVIQFTPDKSSFEGLKSTGQLNLLKEEPLLTDLLSLYNFNYEFIHINNEDVTWYRREFLSPYVFDHFDFGSAFYESAPELKIEALKGDQELSNLMIYGMQTIQSTVQAYQETQTAAKALISKIEERIGE